MLILSYLRNWPKISISDILGHHRSSWLILKLVGYDVEALFLLLILLLILFPFLQLQRYIRCSADGCKHAFKTLARTQHTREATVITVRRMKARNRIMLLSRVSYGPSQLVPQSTKGHTWGGISLILPSGTFVNFLYLWQHQSRWSRYSKRYLPWHKFPLVQPIRKLTPDPGQKKKCSHKAWEITAQSWEARRRQGLISRGSKNAARAWRRSRNLTPAHCFLLLGVIRSLYFWHQNG